MSDHVGATEDWSPKAWLDEVGQSPELSPEPAPAPAPVVVDQVRIDLNAIVSRVCHDLQAIIDNAHQRLGIPVVPDRAEKRLSDAPGRVEPPRVSARTAETPTVATAANRSPARDRLVSTPAHVELRRQR